MFNRTPLTAEERIFQLETDIRTLKSMIFKRKRQLEETERELAKLKEKSTE